MADEPKTSLSNTFAAQRTTKQERRGNQWYTVTYEDGIETSCEPFVGDGESKPHVSSASIAFTIRLADEQDAEALYALLDHETPMMEEEYPYHPSKVVPLMLDAFRDPDSKERCWLAVADEKIVGFIRTEKLGRSVFVEEEYCGRGIGPALVTAHENFYRAQGATEISMIVFADNARAIKAYRKIGYEFDAASRGDLEKYEMKTLEEKEALAPQDVPRLHMTKTLG